ncbi:MAG: RsmB/NOP family class I SAM-dependent RNA methyltransferase [candidate division NC10 bacterium]|jgi:NOL1/NOP2/sun family putative RNA methylase
MVPAFERYRDIIPDYSAFLNSLHLPVPTYLRVNTLRIEREKFRHVMAERGYRLTPVAGVPEAFQWESPGTPGSTLEYFRGWYQVQGLTSMLPPLILDAQAGERVLDLCAAPGGKATYLAQRTGNQALIVANDVSHRRIGILRSHSDRLGITSIVVTRYHGQSFPKRIAFDRVLLDPPCSAEGTYRVGARRPLTEDLEVSRRLQRLQQMLLRHSLDVLRPGGTLVYSTCTYAPEENEAVLHPVVEEGRAELDSIHIPFPYSPGIEAWNGQQFHPSLKHAARFYPHFVNSGGFFIARLRKPA